MNLSKTAIQDLRNELKKIYGTDFELDDNDLNEIGLFLLVSLVEGLKLRKCDIMNGLH
jgi:hypothetical protein